MKTRWDSARAAGERYERQRSAQRMFAPADPDLIAKVRAGRQLAPMAAPVAVPYEQLRQLLTPYEQATFVLKCVLK